MATTVLSASNDTVFMYEGYLGTYNGSPLNLNGMTLNGLGGTDVLTVDYSKSLFTITTSVSGVTTLSTASGKKVYLQNFETIKFKDATVQLAPAAPSTTPSAGNDVITGTSGDDNINSLAGNDSITSLGGNDTLNGGLGNDTLIGGVGNDTYIVDAIGDLVTELLGEGTDTVQSSVSYTLQANIENLTLTGAVAINGTGNSGTNILTGNAAANVLNGGTGADTLIGGAGGDTYVVDDGGDVVQENSTLATEIDTVSSNITYSLANTANGNVLTNVEKLTLTGTSSINATGNGLKNTLTGNSVANVLDGGAGVDTLIGGAGNDTYIVDLTAAGGLQDTVTEALTTDTSDTLQLRGNSTNVAAVALTLAANLENLDASATGVSKLNLTGNTGANTLSGNAAANVLNGLAGADTLIGGDGNDTYVVDNVGDTVTESNALAAGGIDLVQVAIAKAGLPANPYVLGANIENGTLTNVVAYSLTGNTLDNVLTGNAAINSLNGGNGNDTLNGGGGADTLIGGVGNDTYIVDAIGDLVTELLGEGTDTVQSSVSYTLQANIENLTLTGAVAINGTGNSGTNILTGNAAANVLNGGTGADTLIGGAGGDTYVVDDGGDVVQENSTLATEIDTVSSNITYSLANTANGNVLTNVEKLTLTGTSSINATGNGLKNTLTGNSVANVLDGGAGVDTLIGGAGNDTYIVDLTAAGGLQDTVTEALTTDTSDTLQLRGNSTNVAAVALTLAANLENLDASATGVSKLNLTGNTGANTLSGNAAANVLNGLAGADTLIGGDGNDTLTGGLGNDVFKFDSVLSNAGTNTDTITDFSRVAGNTDLVHLSQAIFDQVGIAGVQLDATAFFTGTAAHDGTDRIIYDQVSGALYYDPDGNGAAAQIQFATIGLSAGLHPALSATDFIVVA